MALVVVGARLLGITHDHARSGALPRRQRQPGHQQSFQSIGDLDGEPFLHLQSTGVHLADTSDFREANDLAVGDIGDMGTTQNR